MAKFYATRIIRGNNTFADVPAKLKTVVADYLVNTEERPDLVPAEYGGTMK